MSVSLFRSTTLAVMLGAALALAGCAPLIIGGAAVGGAMVATDRRTSGTQIDDESIELKAAGRVRDVIADRGHVNVTSYNRIVLLTGEVPTESDKATVERAVTGVEQVKAVVNELGVIGNSGISVRSNDAILTSKVKASFVDAKDLQVNSIKVVTERSVVYLMGRVTEREATRAADVTRGVSGVAKVVRVFEVVTEAELAGTPSAPIK